MSELGDDGILESFREGLEAWGRSERVDDGSAQAPGRLAAALLDVGCLCCAHEGPRAALVRVRGVLTDPAAWASTFEAEAERLEVEPDTLQRVPGVTFALARSQGWSVVLMAGMYRAGGVHRLLVLVLTRVLA